MKSRSKLMRNLSFGGICSRLFMAWMLPVVVFAVGEMPSPSLDIQDVACYRGVEDQLAIRMRFADKPDAARIRLLFDSDGPERGEPSSGAKCMVEGATLYHHPEHGGSWAWTPVVPVTVHSIGNDLWLMVSGLTDAVYRCAAVTTATDWSRADVWPDANGFTVDRKMLPELDPGDVHITPADPALDIVAVKPFRLPDGSWAFKVTCKAAPNANRLRIMLVHCKLRVRQYDR